MLVDIIVNDSLENLFDKNAIVTIKLSEDSEC